MNTPTRLGLYGLGLAVAFAGALGVGKLVGPVKPAPAMAGHAEAAAEHEPPGGLQVAEAGYRLVPVTTALRAGGSTDFAFRILGPDGAPVTGYTKTHERALHLIVVRRDLTSFQHVHPTLDEQGTWRIPLSVAAPGQYRVFADFQPAGRDRSLTLGTDIPAAGVYEPQPVPATSRTSEVDGYRVELAGALAPGGASELTATVTRDGRPVTDLEPYLGAYGHLVALRAGDLAYLHVHPGSPAVPGPTVRFHAEVPSAGTYRLFLDFQHAGQVHTAQFTLDAGEGQ